MGNEPAESLLVTMRALVADLQGDGVPGCDVLGTARVGLVTVAVHEGRGPEARRLRDWLLTEVVPPVAPAPSVFGHYLDLASPRWVVFLNLWHHIAEAWPDDDDDGVLTLLCRALDTIEGERLVATLEAD